MEERMEYTQEAAVETREASAQPSRREMRRAFGIMGLGLGLGLLLNQLVPTLLSYIPGLKAQIQAHSFLLGGLCTGLLTLPLMLLLTRRLPARQPDRKGLGAGMFLALVCICYAAMIAGNLVGMAINSLVSPGSMNLISDLASSSDSSLEMILSFVALAPVFEELVFRKVLVDRALPYGEWPAIVFSGVAFGLFHGNLTQFFYAALLGMILAYVYIRTGNILYTMGLHACINFLGGVLPLLFPAAVYGVLLVALAGVILFFVLKKRIHVARDAAPGVGGAMFGNVGMILFILISGIMMALVAIAMGHPELLEGLM